MRKKLVAIIAILLIVFSISVTAYAGPGSGGSVPPMPMSSRISIATASQPINLGPFVESFADEAEPILNQAVYPIPRIPQY